MGLPNAFLGRIKVDVTTLCIAPWASCSRWGPRHACRSQLETRAQTRGCRLLLRRLEACHPPRNLRIQHTHTHTHNHTHTHTNIPLRITRPGAAPGATAAAALSRPGTARSPPGPCHARAAQRSTRGCSTRLAEPAPAPPPAPPKPQAPTPGHASAPPRAARSSHRRLRTLRGRPTPRAARGAVRSSPGLRDAPRRAPRRRAGRGCARATGGGAPAARRPPAARAGPENVKPQRFRSFPSEGRQAEVKTRAQQRHRRSGPARRWGKRRVRLVRGEGRGVSD